MASNFTATRRDAILLLLLLSGLPCLASPAPPEDFPRFHVPGQEKEMESLRRLFWLHYQPAGPLIALWDEWMPMSTTRRMARQISAERRP